MSISRNRCAIGASRSLAIAIPVAIGARLAVIFRWHNGLQQQHSLWLLHGYHVGSGRRFGPAARIFVRHDGSSSTFRLDPTRIRHWLIRASREPSRRSKQSLRHLRRTGLQTGGRTCGRKVKARSETPSGGRNMSGSHESATAAVHARIAGSVCASSFPRATLPTRSRIAVCIICERHSRAHL